MRACIQSHMCKHVCLHARAHAYSASSKVTALTLTPTATTNAIMFSMSKRSRAICFAPLFFTCGIKCLVHYRL